MKFILNESQYNGLDEARKNPATNQDPTLREFVEKVMRIAPLEDIYISFRRTIDVTDVNKHNEFNTPTGVYCYPLSAYDFSKSLDNEQKFRGLFPYASLNPFIHFIVLKTGNGVLDAKTPKRAINEYVRKIKALYKDIKPIVNLCDLFLANKYSSKYTTPSHPTHLFWLFLYDIVAYLTEGGNMKRRVTRINLLCREIGVNGFVDKLGDGFIHEAEPKQAVFFKLKGIANVYIYKTPKFSTVPISMINPIKEQSEWPDRYIVNVERDHIGMLYNFVDAANKPITPIWFESYYDFKVNNITYYVIKRTFKNKGPIKELYFGSDLNESSSRKINVLDISGKLRLSTWVDRFQTSDFINFPVARSVKGGKAALINNDFKLVTDFIYMAIFPITSYPSEERAFSRTFIVQNFEGKYNIIDFAGKEISKSWFDYMDYWYSEDLICVMNGGKYNWLTSSGELLSKIWFDGIDKAFSPYCRVRDDNEGYNLISVDGNLIRDRWFTSIQNESYNGEGRWNLYDQDKLVGWSKPNGEIFLNGR